MFSKICGNLLKVMKTASGYIINDRNEPAPRGAVKMSIHWRALFFDGGEKRCIGGVNDCHGKRNEQDLHTR